MAVQQGSPNPGIVKDDLFKASLYSIVATLNKAAGTILQPGDDLEYRVNSAEAFTTFLLTPGVYGTAATEWTLTRSCRILAMPGAVIYGKVTVQGAQCELTDLQFDTSGQLVVSSNGNTISGATFGRDCTASPLISVGGTLNRVSGCNSWAVTAPGAIGVDISGSSCIATGNQFVTHATSVRYNVAGGHQLAANLGTIVGV